MRVLPSGTLSQRIWRQFRRGMSTVASVVSVLSSTEVDVHCDKLLTVFCRTNSTSDGRRSIDSGHFITLSVHVCVQHDARRRSICTGWYSRHSAAIRNAVDLFVWKSVLSGKLLQSLCQSVTAASSNWRQLIHAVFLLRHFTRNFVCPALPPCRAVPAASILHFTVTWLTISHCWHCAALQTLRYSHWGL